MKISTWRRCGQLTHAKAGDWSGVVHFRALDAGALWERASEVISLVLIVQDQKNEPTLRIVETPANLPASADGILPPSHRTRGTSEPPGWKRRLTGSLEDCRFGVSVQDASRHRSGRILNLCPLGVPVTVRRKSFAIAREISLNDWGLCCVCEDTRSREFP
jgi:hypothetical protein